MIVQISHGEQVSFALHLRKNVATVMEARLTIYDYCPVEHGVGTMNIKRTGA